jgi:hypothetical protein
MISNMKITRRQLKRIIKEEKQKLLKEAGMFPGFERPDKNVSGWNGSYGGSTYEGVDVMQLVSDQLDRIGNTAPKEFWDLLEAYINDVEDAASKGEM